LKKLAFILSLISLLWAQVLALMFERAPEHLSMLRKTPMLETAQASPLMVLVAGVLLFMLFLTRLRREPGPLAAGAFLNGLGHVGLQILALEWLKPHIANPVQGCVTAFVIAAVVGSWRALSRKNEDDSLAIIGYFISVVAAIAFGHFVAGHFGKLSAPANVLLAAGAALTAVPAFFSARASAMQIFLIQPGGMMATMKILVLYAFGGLWGGILVMGMTAGFGLNYATVLVAGVYLLAAWLFTQTRGGGFAGALLTPSA